jgi:flagellar L-ring protein precursor FlgH
MFRALLIVLLATQLGACASTAGRDPGPAENPAARYMVAPSVSEPGAIYASGSGLALFEDVKARSVGDVLTVLLVERTQAQKKASTSTSKDSSVSLGNPTLFGRPLTANGTPIGEVGIEGSREFTGSGDSSQSNKLDGAITVTVMQRLGNGNLVVAGEKHLGLNQGSELIRLQGVIRAADIRPDNTVTSDRIADARIDYRGQGALADANAQGWLSRFFNSPWTPF